MSESWHIIDQLNLFVLQNLTKEKLENPPEHSTQIRSFHVFGYKLQYFITSLHQRVLEEEEYWLEPESFTISHLSTPVRDRRQNEAEGQILEVTFKRGVNYLCVYECQKYPEGSTVWCAWRYSLFGIECCKHAGFLYAPGDSLFPAYMSFIKKDMYERSL